MPDCEKCELDKTCLHPYMQPEGPIETAEILFVAEAPGETEDILHRPLVGESGQILRKALVKAGLEDSYDLNPSTNYAQTPLVVNVVLYNVCLCRPPGNDTPTGTQIKCCFDSTLDLIKKMPKLKLIVPVGNISLRAFTGKQGITSVSGKEMEWQYESKEWFPEETIITKTYKMMPLIHPASFLYAKNRSKIKIFYDHIARIPTILHDGLVTDDAGVYIVIKTMDDWNKFRLELLEQPDFTYDIETTGRNPFTDGFRIKLITFNFKHKEAWALPIWDEPTGEQWSDSDYIQIITDLKEIFENENIGKIGHNVKYDNLCMRVVYDIEVAGTIGDTKLSQYILHPQDSDHLKDMAWQYCLDPNTTILMADLSVKKLGNIQIGDKLLGFDEYTGGKSGRRKFRIATVLNKSNVRKPAIRLTTLNGIELIGSGNHPVLMHRYNKKQGIKQSGDKTWICINEIGRRSTAKYRLSAVSSIMGNIYDEDLIWFGGFLDGEGCYSIDDGNLQFSQNSGIVLDKALKLLNKYGFKTHLYKHENCNKVDILGGIYEHIRLLSLCPSIRLREKFQQRIESIIDFHSYPDEIINKENIGRRELVDIETDTKTFIANGLAVHNSGLGSYEKSLSVATQDAPLAELIPYGSKDSDLTGRIYTIHKKEFADKPILLTTYRDLFVPVQVVLSRMEYNGIRINPPRLNDSYNKAKNILDKTVEAITNYPSVQKYVKKSKKEFNIDSDAQVRTILFSPEYEALVPIKLTGKLKVPSTDKTVFEHFAVQNPLASLFSIYSKYTAVMKTINDIKVNLTPDHRIHTSYWITSTFSGRSSSSNPNLQNIPKGDNDPSLIRKAFIADPDCYLCEFDFNQHELRCMAEEADDDAMRKACISGDVHKATTANLLGIKPEDVTDEQRRNIGKVFNFGLIYGMTVYGIAKKMKLTEKYLAKDRSLTFKQAKWLAEKEAQILLDKFFAVYFKIKQWMDKTAQFVIDNRYVTMRSGLIKYFPSDINLTDHELRSAINIPIQGLAGHILFYALIGTDRFITVNKLKSKLLLEVHDSIVMGIHKSELEIIPEIKHIMCNYFKKFMDFKTPLKVDAKIGENWKIMETI